MDDKKKEFKETAEMLAKLQMEWIKGLEEMRCHISKMPMSIQQINDKIGRRIIELNFINERMLGITTAISKFRIDQEDRKNANPKKFSILINIEGKIPKQTISKIEYDSENSMVV